MKVTLEELNKLKQLDRIEYLLKEDRAEKYYEYNPISLNYISFIVFAVIVLIMLSYIAFGSSSIYLAKIVNLSKLLLYVFFFLYILDRIVYIFYILRGMKEQKMIYNEFFKVEAKKK